MPTVPYSVLLWGRCLEELEPISSLLEANGLHAHAHCGDLSAFEQLLSQSSALVLCWSEQLDEALAAAQWGRRIPVVVLDHVYRAEIEEQLLCQGVAMYLSKRQAEILPAALHRLLSEARYSAAAAKEDANLRGNWEELHRTILHDVANILTGIHGRLKLLACDAEDEIGHELSALEQTSAAALELVRQLFSMTPSRDAASRTNVAESMKHIGALFRAIIPAQIIFEQHPPLEGYDALLPGAQLLQIVLNLLVNARDAVLENTFAEENPAYVPLIQLGYELKESSWPEPVTYLVVHVRDNGPGIADGTLKRIFDPGFTTKPAGKGNGLGLTSVRQVLRAWNGRLEVKTSQGAGSEFLAYIPCAPAEGRPAPAKIAAGSHSSDAILVVEDDLLLGAVLRDLFERMGYELLLAKDSLTALSMLKGAKSSIKLVISDLTLPGVSGLELKEQILALSPEMKFIICSGYPAPEMNTPFVRKPFHTDELLEKVREVLEG